MIKATDLLGMIKRQLEIKLGENDSTFSCRFRIIYSAVGIMSLASLRDINDYEDDEDSVSITYFKRRVEELISSYYTFYLEENTRNDCFAKQFAEYVYDEYEKTGFFYHKPNRICPARFSIATSGNIGFVRSPDLSMDIKMSGLGTYIKNPNKLGGNIAELYFFTHEKSKNYWHEKLHNSDWCIADNLKLEFLNVDFKNEKKYWVNKPSEDFISLARTIDKEPHDYYMYKVESGQLYVSQMDNRYMNDGGYRMIAWLIIREQNPSVLRVQYRYDGELVRIHFGYLLPPRLNNFVQLYSWPEIDRDSDLEHNSLSSYAFKRVMSRDVFNEVKQILIAEKIELEEVSDSSTKSEIAFTSECKVDFHSTKSYSYTKPYKYIYFEKEYCDFKSWTSLYINFMNTLLDDYDFIVEDFENRSFNGKNSRADLCDKDNMHFMVAPKLLSNGMYLETNLSADNIVLKIKKILDICRVDDRNLEIYYKSTKKQIL